MKTPMEQHIVLIVRFRFRSGIENKETYKKYLLTLFEILATEPAFVKAAIHENLDRFDELMVYEVWTGTREKFMSEEMQKSYRMKNEELIIEFDIERTVDWLVPFAEWGTAR